MVGTQFKKHDNKGAHNMPQPKSVDPIKMQTADKMINFRITPSMYSLLVRRSKETGKSISSIIRDSINFVALSEEK